MGTSPLGRSLTPLPDESLPGYLLRLSHRLRISPGRVAMLTGIANMDGHRTGPQISARNMLDLAPGAAASFAHAARLTPEEVGKLCLIRYADRYAPLKHSSQDHAALAHIARRGWTLTGSTRYCPQCLAGDDSPIQQRHGGAWQQLWRLRAVFACAAHGVLLHSRCHQCASLAGSSQGYTRLIPRAGRSGLHPAQCRSYVDGSRSHRTDPVCGARFDNPAMPSVAADSHMLDLQHRILTRLDPAGPTAATEASQYFDLLLLIHTLVMFTWPLATELTQTEVRAEATDRHITQMNQELVRLQAAKPAPGGYNMPKKHLPLESDATAEFLLIADRLLGWDDLDGLASRIRPLVIAATKINPGVWYWLRRHEGWPANVHQTLGHQRQGFAIHVSNGARNTPTPQRKCRFTAQHIPQRLPDDWCHQYLPASDGIAHVHLRRAMALKLIELTTGHPWRYAAEELGLPLGHAADAIQQTRRWMREEANYQRMNSAAEQLAQALDQTPNPVNYSLRRRAMQHWLMPETNWNDFTATVQQLTDAGQGRRYQLTDRRHATTVRIWTAVTSGEHLFAPLVAAHKIANPGLARLAAETIYKTHRGPQSYIRIRTITHSYATQLAAHIDLNETTNHFSWDPSDLLPTLNEQD